MENSTLENKILSWLSEETEELYMTLPNPYSLEPEIYAITKEENIAIRTLLNLNSSPKLNEK